MMNMLENISSLEDEDIESLLSSEGLKYWVLIHQDSSETFARESKISILEKGQESLIDEFLKSHKTSTRPDLEGISLYSNIALFVVADEGFYTQGYSNLALFVSSGKNLSRASAGAFLDYFPVRYSVPSYLMKKIIYLSGNIFPKGIPDSVKSLIKEELKNENPYHLFAQEYGVFHESEYLEEIALIWAHLFPIVAERAINNRERNASQYSGLYDTPFRDSFYYMMGNSSYRNFMSASSIKEFYKSSFGFYRKDFARSLSNFSICDIDKLSRISALLESNELSRAMSDGDEIKISDFFIEELKIKEVSHIPLKLKRKIFSLLVSKDSPCDYHFEVNDVLSMLGSIEISSDRFLQRLLKSKNIIELHDSLLTISSDSFSPISIDSLEEEYNLKEVKPYCKLVELVESIEGYDEDTGEVVHLRQMKGYNDFMYAGEYLGNCIFRANYYKQFLMGKCLLFFIEDDNGELLGALELKLNEKNKAKSLWYVEELSGIKNKELPYTEELVSALDEAIHLFYKNLPGFEYEKNKENISENNSKFNRRLIIKEERARRKNEVENSLIFEEFKKFYNIEETKESFVLPLELFERVEAA